ncbi:hypothetical protein EUTSA_v10002734mg [Eutrema salsugineum]|uniref:Uncharacterized protein n=1 Tax=Eutrema salsugineum TaxID=72664 RepID=V4LAS4_EUTSA|nr:hypothetical protein EUTSA_v10002734mg [Eutrema salsugineum]
MTKARKPKNEEASGWKCSEKVRAKVLHQKLCLSVDLKKRQIYGFGKTQSGQREQKSSRRLYIEPTWISKMLHRVWVSKDFVHKVLTTKILSIEINRVNRNVYTSEKL